MSAVGVDACKGGWVAVVLGGARPSGVFGRSLDEVAGQIPQARGFAVDMPIGVHADRPRSADVQARQLLGPRRSSVFSAPVREALLASTHAEATTTSRRLTGRGLSQQAYALRSKILEAEEWSARAEVPVWEVHPEVSFTVLLGEPAGAPKTTWAGFRQRWHALAEAGIDLGQLEGSPGGAGVDDVLDAAAAAWSAQRLLRGEGRPIPDPPEHADSGRPVAIWV